MTWSDVGTWFLVYWGLCALVLGIRFFWTWEDFEERYVSDEPMGAAMGHIPKWIKIFVLVLVLLFSFYLLPAKGIHMLCAKEDDQIT